MPVKGGQGKTIILYKDLINKSYAVLGDKRPKKVIIY